MKRPTKDDLINALSVMKTVMQKAQLVSEPCDLMIKQLTEIDFYSEKDMERAFIAGWLSNYKTIEDIKGFNFEAAYNNFKTQFINQQ